MKDYPEYNNEEIRYEKKADPREHNVVAMINSMEKRKAELPRVADDFVKAQCLNKQLSKMATEVEESDILLID